ncbi:MAG: class I SAM-dependent methyltransferase [Peptococcaceae bacterium]
MIDLSRVAVTTSQSREHLERLARQISNEINIQYLPRNGSSTVKLKKIFNLDHLIVVREDKIMVDNVFFFHPGMAVARLKMLKAGESDPMIDAMGLEQGDSILDCTLGLANDAIVASYSVGDIGKVVGLESSPIIYAITKWGLKSYSQGSKDCRQAMKNITVIHDRYQDYLFKINNVKYDIVYFDPMFINPYLKSSGIEGLRAYADYFQLNEKVIIQALKIIRKRIVIKDRKDSDFLKRLNVDEIVGGKYSSIKYGIFYK